MNKSRKSRTKTSWGQNNEFCFLTNEHNHKIFRDVFDYRRIVIQHYNNRLPNNRMDATITQKNNTYL